MVLASGAVERLLIAVVRDREDRRDVETGRLPVIDRRPGVEGLDVTDHLVHGPEAELRHELPDLLGDELEEVDDELRPPREPAPQLRILCGDTDRTGVEMADAHHDATRDDERCRGETELLGTEQRGDHHVAAGLQLSIGLHHDPIAQTVHHQRLLGLGQAELPRTARVLQRGQRGRACAAVVPADEHHIGLRLGHSGSDRADPHLRYELHMDPGGGVRVLQVVDELLEILDRVDVVMGRRTDEADPWGRVSGRRDPGVDLVTRQLTALTRLGTLGHLDLDVVGVREVLGGDAEAARGHLLDCRPSGRVVQALGVLPAFSGVRFRSDGVHRHGEGLVRLRRDRSVRHRPGRETLQDLRGRLDLLDRHGHTVVSEPQQTAKGRQPIRLLVDEGRVLLEDVVPLRPRGVLEPIHGLRVEEVVLPLTAPLVLTTDLESAVRPFLGPLGVGERVAHLDGRGDLLEADPSEPAHGAGEVALDEVVGETDRLEDLRSRVRGHGRHTHLRHDLQHTLAAGLDVVAERDLGVHAAEPVQTGVDHVLDRLEGEIGVDGARPVSDQQGHVVHLARIPGLDHQPDHGALTGANEFVVHRRGQQQ